jgi:hypothetical protein
MSKQVNGWLGAALGFGAGIVWTTAGAESALLCVLGAILCAVAVTSRQAGLVGWVAATATGIRKQVAARIPAERPARKIERPKPKAKARAEAPKVSRPVEPKAQAPEPAPKPYDHDEPSSEHVYEVATYGW